MILLSFLFSCTFMALLTCKFQSGWLWTDSGQNDSEKATEMSENAALLCFCSALKAYLPKIISLSIYYSSSNKNWSTSRKLVIFHHSEAGVLRLARAFFLLFMVFLQVLSKGTILQVSRHPCRTFMNTSNLTYAHCMADCLYCKLPDQQGCKSV